MRFDVLPCFDMWRFHRTWAVEKSRNTRRPRSGWLPFINTGFTYPTPRIVRVRKKGTTASRTKGGEKIRTRGIDRRGKRRGSIDGKSGRKLYHLSPRINILWDSIRPSSHRSSLFSFIKPSPRRVSLYGCAYVTVKRWPLESVGLSRRIEVEEEGISGTFFERCGEGEPDSPSRMGNL